MKTRMMLCVLFAVVIGLARAEEKFGGAKPAEVDYKQLGYDNELFTLDGKPYSGVAIKKDKQGRKRGRYEYASGKLTGIAEEWFTNGVKCVETSFANGVRNGTNTYWGADGSLLKRQVWRDGKLIDSTEKHDLEQPAP